MSNTRKRMFGLEVTKVRHNRRMEKEIAVAPLGIDGPLVEIGPLDPLGDFRLQVPSFFSRKVEYAGLSRNLEIRIRFLGDKLEIGELCIKDSQGPIGSRDLLQLSLPQVVRACAASAIPQFEFWSLGLGGRPGIGEALRNNRLLLSKLYWFEYATWGAPRVAIQELLACKRTTANYFIRLASEEHSLPESRKRGD